MKVFIVAGEASGDLLGAALMRGLSQLLEEPPEFIGVGGEEMSRAKTRRTERASEPKPVTP